MRNSRGDYSLDLDDENFLFQCRPCKHPLYTIPLGIALALNSRPWVFCGYPKSFHAAAGAQPKENREKSLKEKWHFFFKGRPIGRHAWRVVYKHQYSTFTHTHRDGLYFSLCCLWVCAGLLRSAKHPVYWRYASEDPLFFYVFNPARLVGQLSFPSLLLLFISKNVARIRTSSRFSLVRAIGLLHRAAFKSPNVWQVR